MKIVWLFEKIVGTIRPLSEKQKEMKQLLVGELNGMFFSRTISSKFLDKGSDLIH